MVNKDPVMFILETPDARADLRGSMLQPPAYPGDAGMDVEITEQTSCYPHSITRAPIGIRIAPPPGTVFTFITRSSAVIQGLFVIPTLIDGGYRGPLFLFIMNATEKHMVVPVRTKIAQVLLLPNLMEVDGEPRPVRQVNMLPKSARGENGFGSTGSGI